MARIYSHLYSLNKGAVGSLLEGRQDLDVSKQACRKIDNFYVNFLGALVKRKGSKYISEVKTSANKTRLIPFIFSNVDSFVLEFGNLYIRFYQNLAAVGAPYEIASPYATADIPLLKYYQIDDIMYITHPNYAPRKLTRIATASWTIAEVNFQLGPVEDVNLTATTVTLTGSIAVGGTSTWTASLSIFLATDVGTVWAIANTSNAAIGYAKMTGYTSGTVATFTNQSALFALTTASANWYAPTWSSTKGYPRAVTGHEERVFYAGTTSKPLGIWGSKSGRAFEVFDKGTGTASDAIALQLSGRNNTIQWLVSDGFFLTAGTFGGLSFVGGGQATTALTPTNIAARNGTSYGGSSVQGIAYNTRITYPHRSGKTLYQAQYDDLRLTYQAENLNLFNDEILNDGISEISLIEEPFPALLNVVNGDLKNLTQLRELEQSVQGWFEYSTDGAYESIAVIPKDKNEEIWVIVNRTIGGSPRRFVEVIENNDNKEVYVDSYKEYTGSNMVTFTGLSHLNGKQVYVAGNGMNFGLYTVSAGSVTINNNGINVTEAYVGLPYNADIETLPMTVENNKGNNFLQKYRISKLKLLLYKTNSLSVGRTVNELEDLEFRTVNDAMDTAVPYYGNVRPQVFDKDFSGEYSDKDREVIYIRSKEPTPCTLVGLTAVVEFGND